MENAANIQASDVENENPLTVSAEKNLAQIKALMEEEEIRAVPVVKDEEFQGAIGYRELIRHLQFNPKKTKISKVLHQPPEYDENDSLIDLADLRINSGRKLLVRVKGGKVQGVVGDKEFLEIASDTEEFSSVSTGNLASQDVIKAFEEDSLEKTRHTMLDNNISRLPVVDKNGNLTGIIRSTDLLKAMIPMESPDSGGTSGGRHGTKEINIAGGDEKDKMSDIPVEELMQRTVTTSEEHMKADKAAGMMTDQDSGEIVFVDGKYPESIVTAKDLIDHLESLKASNTVLVQLVGLEVPEEKAALHEKVRTQLRGSLGRKLESPEELTIHIKKAEKDGKKHRYEFNAKLYSEYGITNVQADGWDMLEVMDEVLDELNTVIGKKKDKKQEKRR
ncbi:CBS domain-containing protein [Candidatus Nanosalina sp. VS9-1]|uniref:CBS domain-containing protein n=1 Tax=Candidatus Nanosalina sp. VS9-1 TaxID=3388566 RepID=UPI0039E181F3